MDSRQLRDVLSRDLGRSFIGVYPRDLLPNQIRPYEKAIITINPGRIGCAYIGTELM